MSFLTIAEQLKRDTPLTGDGLEADEPVAHAAIDAALRDNFAKVLAEIPADYKNNPFLTGEKLRLREYAYYYLWEQLFPEGLE